MSIIELENIRENIELRNSLISLKSKFTDKKFVSEIKSDKLYSIELFKGLLSNEDPKVRKNTVLIMGQLEDVQYKQIIFDGYMNEETLFVKSAYLRALRAYDYAEYKSVLQDRMLMLMLGSYEENELKHIAEELHELKVMFPDATKKIPHIQKDPDHALTVYLACKKEFVNILSADAEKVLDTKVSKIFCGVSVKTKELSRLPQIRTYKEVLFPVNGMKAFDKENLVKEIIKGDLFSILKELHLGDNETYYFRISGNSINSAKAGRELEIASKGQLINSVSDYEIELRFIDNKDGKTACMLKLFTKEDKRFSYRKNVVATSLHPVNAASFVKLVEEDLARHAQIIDPFCGVGTLLIERNKLLMAKFSYGVDIFGEAISGARENAERAKQSINFIQRDFFEFKHEHLFDEVITEMPSFKIGMADDFYRQFFDKCSSILKKQGHIIMSSNEMGIVKKYLRLHDELSLEKEIPFNIKEDINIFVIEKVAG